MHVLRSSVHLGSNIMFYSEAHKVLQHNDSPFYDSELDFKMIFATLFLWWWVCEQQKSFILFIVRIKTLQEDKRFFLYPFLWFFFFRFYFAYVSDINGKWIAVDLNSHTLRVIVFISNSSHTEILKCSLKNFMF